jgi:MFS family permease
MLHLTTGNLPFLIGFAVKALHWGNAAIAFLSLTPFLCLFAQPPVTRWLQARYSLRQIIILGFVVNAVPWMLLPLFPWLDRGRDLVFAIIVLTSTLANSVCGVAWSAAVSELVPLNIRGSYFGRRNVFFGAWSLAVTLTAGQLADAYDNALRVFAFIFLAASIARFGGLFYFLRMKFPVSVTERQPREKVAPTLQAALRDFNFMRLILFTGMFGMCLYLGNPYYSVFVLNGLHFTLGDLTILTTLGTLGGLLSLKTWGPLSDRFGNKPVLITTALIWLTTASACWLFSGPTRNGHLYANYFLTGFMFSGFELCQFNVMIKMVPSTHRTHYISMYLSLTRMLWAMGPPLGALILWKLPDELGTWLGQPLTKYHVLIVSSLVMCMIVLNLLHTVREPAERPARELIAVMANMREFNPLLALASVAYFMFTPRGLSRLAHVSVRTFRRQTSAVTEVGEDLVEEGLRALIHPFAPGHESEEKRTDPEGPDGPRGK